MYPYGLAIKNDSAKRYYKLMLVKLHAHDFSHMPCYQHRASKGMCFSSSADIILTTRIKTNQKRSLGDRVYSTFQKRN